jgi:hypothetical protein
MIEEVQARQYRQSMQGMERGVSRQQVKQEFMAIFYKELLKQSFKPPKFGLEDNKSFMGTFGSDILLDKMAMQLAADKAFSADKILPKDIERLAK